MQRKLRVFITLLSLVAQDYEENGTLDIRGHLILETRIGLQFGQPTLNTTLNPSIDYLGGELPYCETLSLASCLRSKSGAVQDSRLRGLGFGVWLLTFLSKNLWCSGSGTRLFREVLCCSLAQPNA